MLIKKSENQREGVCGLYLHQVLDVLVKVPGGHLSVTGKDRLGRRSISRSRSVRSYVMALELVW